MAVPAELPHGQGRYVILSSLARGGMAELFLARAVGIAGIERLVVLKRILPELAEIAKFRRMFLDEARVAVAMQHANVVHTYDVGEDAAGGYFLAMEYLAGEDVWEIQRAAARHTSSGAVPVAEAVTIAMGLSAGLHHAHERVSLDGQPLHIVHRDVSPHNVAVTYDGCVKVVDFGIAKAARRLEETRRGTLKGKLPYMSPEQALGHPVDRRSDVFAVSIMLWELTTGQRLFVRHSPLETLEAVVSAEVLPPSRIVADYPRELEEIVLRGLSREPERRFATAEELRLALEEMARRTRLAATPARLAGYLAELFPARVAAWTAARERGGRALETFVMTRPGREEGETANRTDFDRPPAPARPPTLTGGDDGPLAPEATQAAEPPTVLTVLPEMRDQETPSDATRPHKVSAAPTPLPAADSEPFSSSPTEERTTARPPSGAGQAGRTATIVALLLAIASVAIATLMVIRGHR